MSQQPFPPSPYGGALPPARTTSGRAVASLVLGIISLVLCGFLTGIPAIITGRGAMKEVDASGGALDGRGLAVAGLVTGIIGTVVSALGAALIVFVVVVGTHQHCTVYSDSNGNTADTCDTNN